MRTPDNNRTVDKDAEKHAKQKYLALFLSKKRQIPKKMCRQTMVPQELQNLFMTFSIIDDFVFFLVASAAFPDRHQPYGDLG